MTSSSSAAACASRFACPTRSTSSSRSRWETTSARSRSSSPGNHDQGHPGFRPVHDPVQPTCWWPRSVRLVYRRWRARPAVGCMHRGTPLSITGCLREPPGPRVTGGAKGAGMAKTLTTKRSGWLTFAGVTALVVGGYNALSGIAALSDDDTLVAQARDVLYGIDLTLWGW